VAATPQANRRRKSIIPGQKYALGLRITGEAMQLLEQEAAITGRTQSEQATHCIYWYVDHVKQMGGPQALSYWQSLAQLVQSQFPGESWLKTYDDYMAVMALLREELARRTPPLKIAIQDQIDAGYRIAAQLATTPAKFPRRRAHLQDMLEVMSRCPDFPEADREVFRRAAGAEPPLEVDQPPSAPPPRPTAAHPFWTAWSLGRVGIGLSSGGPETEAEAEAVAEYFAQRADLAFLAGMPARPSAKQVFQYRALLVEHGLGPPAVPTDEASEMAPAEVRSEDPVAATAKRPPPTKRRRSSRPAARHA